MKKDPKLYKQAMKFIVDYGVWEGKNKPYKQGKFYVLPSRHKWTQRLYKLLLKTSKKS